MRRRQSRPVRGDFRGSESGCSGVNAAAKVVSWGRQAEVRGRRKVKMYVEFWYDSSFCIFYLNALFFHTLKLNKFTLHQFAKHTSPPPPQHAPTTCAALRHVSPYAAVSLQLRLPLAAWCVYISNKSGALSTVSL